MSDSIDGEVNWKASYFVALKERDVLQQQLEQKDKQLDRQEAAMLRLKEHDSYQRATINKLRQKIKKGNGLKARNEKLECDLLKAKELFEQSESPFYEGMKTLNQLNEDQPIKESDGE